MHLRQIRISTGRRTALAAAGAGLFLAAVRTAPAHAAEAANGAPARLVLPRL